jgi:hypothetical protein
MAVGRLIIVYLSSINLQTTIESKLIDLLINFSEVWDSTGLSYEIIE